MSMVTIHYELPDELHRRAKAAAAREGITLKAFIERALELEVERAEQPPKRKSRR